jgi:hypothetical protein
MWTNPSHQFLDTGWKGAEIGLSDGIATEDWSLNVELSVPRHEFKFERVFSHIHILRSPWYKERTGGRDPTKQSLLGLRESCLLIKIRRKWPPELTGIELV